MKSIKQLNEKFNKLQLKYGSKDLNAVFGGGCNRSPKVALVFMNPTKRNIATDKAWDGIKTQWLGTKQIWDFLTKCGLFDEGVNEEIKFKKPQDWNCAFCEKVYDEVKKQGVWITNLAKCSQDDARPLSNEVFEEYKELLNEELSIIKPHKILFFGNQVARFLKLIVYIIDRRDCKRT